MKKTIVIADGKSPSNTAPIQGDMEYCFKKAQELGFDAVQLTAWDAAMVDVDEICNLCEKYKMAVSAIATGGIYMKYGFSMGMDDEEKRSKAVSYMNGLADVCAAIGRRGNAPFLIIGAVRGKYCDASSPETFKAAFDKSAHEIISYASSLGVTTIIEAIEMLESEHLRDITETADYIRSFNTPYFKLQLDTMHMRRENQSFDKVDAAYDVAIQADLSGEARRAPALDDYDYAGLFEHLKKINFRGWLTFEFEPDDEDGLARTVEMVDKLRK